MAVESMAEHNFMVGPEGQRLEDDVETIQYIRLPTVTFKAPVSLFSGLALGLALAYCSDLREVSGFDHWNIDAHSQCAPLKLYVLAPCGMA
jgi:hypothetical protein